MAVNVDPEKIIIEVLKRHPEGLAIIEIAKLTQMNRITVAKYIHGLLIKDKIYQRKIGAVKLCYLKENFQGNSEVIK